jgi:hypothetical protein
MVAAMPNTNKSLPMPVSMRTMNSFEQGIYIKIPYTRSSKRYGKSAHKAFRDNIEVCKGLFHQIDGADPRGNFQYHAHQLIQTVRTCTKKHWPLSTNEICIRLSDVSSEPYTMNVIFWASEADCNAKKKSLFQFKITMGETCMQLRDLRDGKVYDKATLTDTIKGRTAREKDAQRRRSQQRSTFTEGLLKCVGGIPHLGRTNTDFTLGVLDAMQSDSLPDMNTLTVSGIPVLQGSFVSTTDAPPSLRTGCFCPI